MNKKRFFALLHYARKLNKLDCITGLKEELLRLYYSVYTEGWMDCEEESK